MATLVARVAPGAGIGSVFLFTLYANAPVWIGAALAGILLAT